MNKRTFKDQIYTTIAGMGKAFSSANRLEILDLLANGEKSVEAVAEATAISIANASHHLQLLKSARMVKSRREGNFIYYALASREVLAAWKALRDLALAREPETQLVLREFREGMNGQAGLSYRELGDSQEGRVFLDVRPADEFAAGHLPGAWLIPIDELPARLAELPKDKKIIAYCRGPFCTYADEAVQMLRARGFDAVRLEEGVADIKLEEGQWRN